jgi:hypothetical protein
LLTRRQTQYLAIPESAKEQTMKSPVAPLLAAFAALLLSGCGPSIYYQYVQFSGQGTTVDAKTVLESTARELGYGSCGIGRAGDYCKGDQYLFRLVREDINTVELEFESMRGGLQQEAARQALANTLQQRCPSCRVRIKDRRERGLIKDDTGWMNMPK